MRNSSRMVSLDQAYLVHAQIAKVRRHKRQVIADLDEEIWRLERMLPTLPLTNTTKEMTHEG